MHTAQSRRPIRVRRQAGAVGLVCVLVVLTPGCAVPNNNDTIPPECDAALCAGASDCTDCDGDGVLDTCELAECAGDPACSDCDGNAIPDGCDIAACAGDPACGDCDGDAVPDVCAVGAVDEVVAEIEALAVTLAAFADMSGTSGANDCPIIDPPVLDLSDPTCTFPERHDFGAGCTNDTFAQVPVAGVVILCRSGATFTGVGARFETLAIDDVPIDGTVSLAFTEDLTDGATLEGTIALDTASGGQAEGDIIFLNDRDTGILSIYSATLSLTHAGVVFDVLFDGIEIDAAGTGSFVPVAGSVEFVAATAGSVQPLTLAVRFSADTPGTVAVAICDADAVAYELGASAGP